MYRQRPDLFPDFRVRYSIYPAVDGGRMNMPRQGIRTDFRYDGDELDAGLWMIWPDFLSEHGVALPEGEVVRASGTADMFILNRELVPYHLARLAIGTKGYLMEGTRKVASCEVISVREASANALQKLAGAQP